MGFIKKRALVTAVIVWVLAISLLSLGLHVVGVIHLW